MKRVLTVICLFLFSLSAPLWAQVSLGSGHQTNVTVTVDGEPETFIVMKDYKKADQFYYKPNQLRLATRGTGSKKRPVFHLLKYQDRDPDTNELVEGGVLQFSVRLDPGNDVVTQIRAAVAEQFKLDAKTIKLAPLPFKSAEISIYDLKGNLLTTEFQKPGIAPAFANSEIPFQVQLTNLTSDIYEALTRGGGGIPVYVTYTFDQISPANGFKVTVDWDQTFNHFSKDERTRQAFTQWYYYRTWWGARRARAKTGVQETKVATLSEILEENKSIKVESIVGQDFSQEEINFYLDPIIERINKELVEKMTPPEKVDAAVAKDPANPGYWRTATNMTLKSVNKVKKGKETIEFNRRHIFETKDTYGSLLGIGGYKKEIQDELITIKPAGNWNYSYFSVPAVGDSEALAIKRITMSVVPKYYDKSGRLRQIPGAIAQLVTWDPDNGYFVDRKNNEVNNILFPMQAITAELEKKKIPLTDCVYEVNIEVTQDRTILKFQNYEEFIMGGIPVSTPMARIEGVEIDCDIGLTFGDRSEKDSLAAVTIRVTSEYPKKTYNTTIKENTSNKCPVFLVEKEDEGKKNKVIATINFILFGGKKIAWSQNGRNLQDDDMGLSVMLWDEDYMQQ